MANCRWWVGVLAAAVVAADGAAAQGAGSDAADAYLVRHPWVVSPPNAAAEAYFLDLKDGDRIETPFILRFGLSMRGLAPAEISPGKAGKTVGHHHLLVNFPIPKNMTKPLPFTENYVHYGKGQMQEIVTLKPGTYNLALLLADEDHVPMPVYSKPIRVTVTKFDPNANIWRMWGTPRIEIHKPADGETVNGPFRVNFHASAFNIGTAAAKAFDTGHFRLSIEPRGKAAEVLDFTLGQTEVWLKPPKGEYTMRLELLANPQPGKVLATAPVVRVKVAN